MISEQMTATISDILSKMGCTESYIFGSHVTGGADEIGGLQNH